jgi:hypothetical protein
MLPETALTEFRSKIRWADGPEGFVIISTDTRPTYDGTLQASLADFAMFKGNYWVEVMEGQSETAGPVTPDFGTSEACGNNRVASSPFHISFEIVFERTGN